MNTEDLTTRAVNFIRFHGVTLLVAEHAGTEYVALKPLSDLAGLDWRRTKSGLAEGDSAELFGTKRLIPPVIDAVGGLMSPPDDSEPAPVPAQKTVLYIRLDRARMYLARINTSRMRANGNAAAADQLLALQIEWAEALHSYETNGVAVKAGRGNALRDLQGLFKARASTTNPQERKGLDWLIAQEMKALGVPDEVTTPAQGALPV